MSRLTTSWSDNAEHIVGGSMAALTVVACVLIYVSAHTQAQCPVPRWVILASSLIPFGAMTWLTVWQNRPSAWLT
jgi:hypothetical protein